MSTTTANILSNAALLQQRDALSVYLSTNNRFNQPVLVKMVNEPTQRPRKARYLENERKILQNLKVDGVPALLGQELVDGRQALLFEYFDGQTLFDFLKREPVSPQLFLELATQLVRILAELHANSIIHRDISSHNVLINARHELRIIDFNLASSVSVKSTQLDISNLLEGNPHYISPEQTGRMNRAVDHRSDLYSLGVVFYEMLTGNRPFESTDTLGLVHAHIARVAEPVATLNPQVPPLLSAMVEKLMAKNAEDRYQTANGLLADLQRCRDSQLLTGAIAQFELGKTDALQKFLLPQQLFGRETPQQQLRSAFAATLAGERSMVLIGGSSGTGKSALAMELSRLAAENNGYFISGKFDQFQQRKPYYGIVRAFEQLVATLLMADQSELDALKHRILAAIGTAGQSLIDLIPDIEHILGPQPDQPQVGISETQNRINFVFTAFVGALTETGKPLILNIDDLQWADAASLNLLELLLNAGGLSNFLLIGAYRPNEVGASHPLSGMLDELQGASVALQTIELGDLPKSAVVDLVAETLRCTTDRAQGLAELVFAKTHGNPFFVRQFLRSLYDRKLLRYDLGASCWNWEEDRIRQLNITENVVGFLEESFNTLPAEVLAVLQAAAIIGNDFDLESLQELTNHSASEVNDAIDAILEYHYLISDGDSYSFVHDRIRQALLENIPANQLLDRHMHYGRSLLAHLDINRPSVALFEAANHLNKAPEHLDQLERPKVATLNLNAGKKAMETAAYDLAGNYFEAGLGLLSQRKWDGQYELALALHIGAAEAAFMRNDFAQLGLWTTAVFTQAQQPTDTVRAYVVRIKGLQAQGKLKEALNIGLDALAAFGVKFPAKPNMAHIIVSLLKTKRLLSGKTARHIVELPAMEDSNSLAVMDIVSNLVAVAYLTLPELLPLLFFKQIERSIKHGNSVESPTAYVGYGTILCAMGDFVNGERYGQIAIELAEQAGYETTRCKIAYGANSLVFPWRINVNKVQEPLQEAIQFGLESGDWENTAYAIASKVAFAQLNGTQLPALKAMLDQYANQIEALKYANPLYLFNIHREMVEGMLSAEGNPVAFEGKYYDEAVNLPLHLEANDLNMAGLYAVNKLYLCALFGQYEAGAAVMERVPKFEQALTANIALGTFYACQSLVLLKLVQMGQHEHPKKAISIAKRNLRKLKKWSNHASENLLQKYELVQAELLHTINKADAAGGHYQRAIDLSAKHGFANDLLMANELASQFYRGIGNSHKADELLRSAHKAAVRWGNIAKQQQLLKEYPEVVGKLQLANSVTQVAVGAGEQTVSLGSEFFDLESVLKASRAISEPVSLPELLNRLLNIMLENAGAERGYLILEEHREWKIMAAGQAGTANVETGQARPVRESADLAQAVVNYVTRTSKPLVIHDALANAQYQNDLYIQENRPRSILCSPFLKQGKLIGVVYLENNLAPGAFTQGRLELLTMLSAQAAISIENARLYANMEALNRAYERFVPKQFLSLLQKASITDVELGNQTQQEMTVMFSDIRNFTALSEQMTPQENFNFLNRYLQLMEPVITQHRGFIDKYIGDAIMGLFPSEPTDAVQCALGMLELLARFNRETSTPISIGIGLNTGKLMLGTIGGTHRMDGTVISDAVNLTSRVEAMTKNYRIPLIITEHTYNGLRHPEQFHIRKLDEVIAKGKTKPVVIYEVFDADSTEQQALKSASKSDFETGLQDFLNGDYQAALEHYRKVLESNPEDKPAAFFADRCNQFLQMG